MKSRAIALAALLAVALGLSAQAAAPPPLAAAPPAPAAGSQPQNPAPPAPNAEPQAQTAVPKSPAAGPPAQAAAPQASAAGPQSQNAESPAPTSAPQSPAAGPQSPDAESPAQAAAPQSPAAGPQSPDAGSPAEAAAPQTPAAGSPAQTPAPPAPAGGPRWRLQYFYDPPNGGQFAIFDMAFASPARGMAVGVVEDDRKTKPYAVATADGGETWAPVRLPESPLSLFFLSEKAGWLVGKDDIWRTPDFGQTWKKLTRAPGTTHVHFLDEQHGWAIGAKKSVHETVDGGVTWKDVPAAAEPKTSPEFTEYGAIAFATPGAGMIAGWSKPPRRGGTAYQIPDWVDPEESGRREWPSVTVTLETQDGGTHWKVGETSMFGQVTNLSLAPDGRGLGLVEFFDKFDFPSEVFRLDLKSGKSDRVFRRKDRAVTDVLISAAGPAFLAAVEPLGTLPRSPVPGKLKILSSTDLENWQEMPVDYRAVARRANLAGSSPSGVWVATDTGMILKLTAQ